ncbi:glycosyl hydrolase family 71-domain-containing protein [Aspergillus carlsbadensis]|nr:glycosyl hydrolase family 71-domain-containing protein [Aspergillus carlsbadensis]
MWTVKDICVLVGACWTVGASAAVIQERAIQQGWSLQASNCPGGSVRCGTAACCPSGLFCNTAGNFEVAACCATAHDCRGSVQGAPTCADGAWSRWQGAYGNSFCCQTDMIGVYDYSTPVAGTCVAPGQAGTATSARLVSRGADTATSTGTSTTTISSGTTTSATTTTATTTASTTRTTTGIPTATRAVFAHYMVGSMRAEQAPTDIRDAINAGFNGFALNTHTLASTDQWNLNAIQWLLDAARGTNFRLFLSFDMSWGLDTKGLGAFLQRFSTHESYYRVDGKPFVSTFWGGNIPNSQWESDFIRPLAGTNSTPFFVPDFDDWSGWPNDVFGNFPSLDGVFSWEAAWPAPGTGQVPVSDAIDRNVLAQARAAGKVYMMPLSPFQFKWFGNDRWYRIGETNLGQRMQQILNLQPHLVQMLTWNDAGEGHYVGNVWPEQIAGTEIPSYTDGFDHAAWLQVLTPFMHAYRDGVTDVAQIRPPGDTPVGAFWYRTLLTSASCSSSIRNHEQAQDAINYAVILPAGAAGYTIDVISDNQVLGRYPAGPGLNYRMVLGLRAGLDQRIVVRDSAGTILSTATGTKAVLAQSSSAVCNWNYEVAGLS